MTKPFAGKHALITGGSSGIGLEIAKKLARLGAVVTILARDPKKLDSACTQIREAAPAGQVSSIQADVTDRDAIKTETAEIEKRAGAPDLLFNCASIADAGRFVDHDYAIFHEMMEINYFGTLNMIMAVLPGMIKRGSGHIVNLSSVAGYMGIYGYSAYGPTKFAVRGLSDTLRSELTEQGIRVSIVFPSDTQTPQLDYENQHKPPILRELDKSNKVLPADVVAESILKGVVKGRYVITPSFESSLYYQLTNFFGLVYPVMDVMVAAARRAVRGQDSRPKHDR